MRASLLFSFLLAGAAFAQEAPKEPVVTKGSVMVKGVPLDYTATAGLMPIRNDQDTVEGHLFYVAYTKDGEDHTKRPVTITFNGGPGSSTMWLHMGGLGPKRVDLTDTGDMPQPPFRYVDNPDTWLDSTDLVFVDAMGTGYSRPVKEGLDRSFYGMRNDIEKFAEFIRAYLSKNGRFGSPLFLCGESYGGIRAGGLSKALLDRGIALNGAIIVSGVTNYSTIRAFRGHDVSYLGYLPSFAATAYHHGKVSQTHRRKPIDDFLKEVETFTSGEYARALLQGTSMPEADRRKVAKKMSDYTGLSEQYCLNANLRVSPSRFFKELLRDEGQTVGRLDSRFKGRDNSAVGDGPEYDASASAITPVFNTVINDYLAKELKYTSDSRYRMNYYGGVQPWEYGQGGSFTADTSDDLRRALNENPYMNVLLVCGYFDLACPYYAMKYAVDHMQLGPDQLKRVSWKYYPAGHMMYIEKGSRERLQGDLASFYRQSLKN